MSRVRDLISSLTAVVEAVEDDRLDAVLAHGPVDDVEAAITRARDLLASAIEPGAAPRRPAVEYRLLGPVEAVADGRPLELGSTKQRRLLLRLLVAHGQRVTVDNLIDAVWGDAPPDKPRASVQAYVSRLRRVLDGSGTIQALDTGYTVDLGDGDVDLHRAERLLARARQHRDDPQRAARACGRALALWRGRPADELGDHLAAMTVRARAADVRRRLTRQRTLALLDLGETDRAVTELTAAVHHHVYDEPLHGLLLRALARQGRHGVALASYERFRSRLAEDLGADPGPELQALLPQLMGAGVA